MIYIFIYKIKKDFIIIFRMISAQYRCQADLEYSLENGEYEFFWKAKGLCIKYIRIKKQVLVKVYDSNIFCSI